MMEQPYSVIEGSAMAAAGAMMLGLGRARYATLILPLLYGDTAQQRAAAQAYQALATALREHPELVEAAKRDVEWTSLSADLATREVTAYADDAESKAASPQASADSLNLTADVYDVLGKAAFLAGASILTAGVMYRVAQFNPYTKVAAEVAATGFGRRADQQAGQIAARARAWIASNSGLLSRVVERLASLSAGGKVALGGAAVVAGGVTAQTAVADRFRSTALDASTGTGRPALPQSPFDAAAGRATGTEA
ncbi:hypothetical protein ACU635_48660 [[Actinomadura] parvosata]|uniref:hypothetical protein n=1 Tax=[Actinomadura] parvosata TaxID=1955412 RepID=UPI00406CF27B